MKLVAALAIVALLGLLITSRFRPAVLFGSVAVLFYVLGYLDLPAWLGSYTNASLSVLVLLLLVSAVLEKTLLGGYCARFLITRRYRLSLLRLGVVTAAVSGFLNNTAVVASLMAVVRSNRFHAPSRLLIPLSYCSIAGGVTTLIGTSTNLIVNSLVVEQQLPSLGFFDFLPVGLLLCAAVTTCLLLICRLLPEYPEQPPDLQEYLIVTRVLPGSPLIGRSILDNGLRNLGSLFLFEIERDGTVLSPVGHHEIIRAGDRLIFSGDITHLEILERFRGLSLGGDGGAALRGLRLIDVIVSQDSALLGRPVRELGFRARFNAAIIALRRGRRQIRRIGATELRPGDRLILAVGRDYGRRRGLERDFIVLSELEPHPHLGAWRSAAVLAAFAAVITLAALEVVELSRGLLLMLLGCLAARLISLGELRRRFPLDIFIIVGSSLAITKVLVGSGLAADAAGLILDLFGSGGVYGSFAGVYLLTLCLTEIITNNAAAALALPIGLATAEALGVSPYPFIFAVAYGASAGFMMPHGYQTHLMVGAVCGYRTTDFMRVGWLVSIAYSAVVLTCVPLVFAF